jgi:hypothetical protein
MVAKPLIRREQHHPQKQKVQQRFFEPNLRQARGTGHHSLLSFLGCNQIMVQIIDLRVAKVLTLTPS